MRDGLTIVERTTSIPCFIVAQGGCEAQLRGHAAVNERYGDGNEFLIIVVSNDVPLIGCSRSLCAMAVNDKVTGGDELP